MKRSMKKSSRGFSMAEILVVVLIIGLIVGVTLPALAQLFPQYRIRSAASEVATAARMARHKAVATRRATKLSFDFPNDSYAAHAYDGSGVLTDPANWIALDSQWSPEGTVLWKKLPADLRVHTTALPDIDGDGYQDLVFMRNGTVNAPSFTPPPGVVMGVDSSLVRFNRYRITAGAVGRVDVFATKE